MKNSVKNICQSCGMPMSKISDFGTYDNGNLNTEHCHYCYKNGEFIDLGITMEEKNAKNINIAEKMGKSVEEATTLANSTIPKLKRWRSSTTSKLARK